MSGELCEVVGSLMAEAILAYNHFTLPNHLKNERKENGGKKIKQFEPMTKEGPLKQSEIAHFLKNKIIEYVMYFISCK